MCDGLPVRIEQHHGRWSVADEGTLEAELSLLDCLGDQRRTLQRIREVCSALNHGLEWEEAKSLNRQLRRLDRAYPANFAQVSARNRIAVTRACASVRCEAEWQWLLWMLSKRLEPHLGVTGRDVPDVWVVPGWLAWPHRDKCWEFDDSFVEELGDEFWEPIAAHRDERVAQLAVAVDPGADPECLARLAAQSRHLAILDLVAVHPATPESVIEEITAGWQHHPLWHLETFLRALQNPAMPPEMLAAITDFGCDTRRASDAELWESLTLRTFSWVAASPNCPSSVLWRIADEFAGSSRSLRPVRQSIARNPNTDMCLLEEMADDLDPGVRASLARNPKVTSQLLETLAEDRNRQARAAAARHPDTPPDALERLAADRVPSVRAAAEANLSTPDSVAVQRR